MSKSKMMFLEVTPEVMIMALETMAEMLVHVKENPKLTNLIPGDPARLIVTVLEQSVEHFNRKDEVTDEEVAEAKQKMDELLAKVGRAH